MEILFIYNGSSSIGIEYLSSMLKSKGHRTSLLFDPAVFSGQSFFDIPFLGKMYSLKNKIINKAIKQMPDLICFSCFTGNYKWCLEIAREIKKEINVPIVFGGVHVTAVPKIVLKNDCVDFVIIGEGDYAILDLVEHIESKKTDEKIDIDNLGYKINNKILVNLPRPYIKNLDLPFPDKELFYDKIPVRSYSIMTSRGCPYDCTYCSNSLLHRLYSQEKNHVRRRSVQNVIEELKIAKSKYNIKSVTFMDDVFDMSLDWLKEFIPLYKKEIGLKFSCASQPNIMSRDIAKLLKDGGCWCVSIGVQSGSKRIRKDIYHRYESNERIMQSCSLVKEYKMRLFVDLILDAPTETEEDVLESLKLLSKIKPDRLGVFFLTYYPETQIVSHLNKGDYDMICQGIIGYTRSLSSFDKKKKSMYKRYWLLFQLRVLFNDFLYNIMSKIIVLFPFKVALARLATLFVSIKILNVRYLHHFQYVFSKKNVP